MYNVSMLIRKKDLANYSLQTLHEDLEEQVE